MNPVREKKVWVFTMPKDTNIFTSYTVNSVRRKVGP